MVRPYNGTVFSPKKEGILTYATMWMNLEDIRFSGINQTQKVKYDMTPLK